MHKSVIVVDDVYDEAERIRRAALQMSYAAPAGMANYPGRNSAQKLLLRDTDRMLSWVAGEPLVGAAERAHGAFRVTLAGDSARYRVHVDVGVDWSGVLFLTGSDCCQGGTQFFRHRAYGTDHAPLCRADLECYGAASAEEALDKVLGRDSNDPDKWELAMTVPMRFNRLVLFRSLLWHGASEGFGDRPENGRLVQLFFLRRAPPPAAA
jgi:hypothetical protein